MAGQIRRGASGPARDPNSGRSRGLAWREIPADVGDASIPALPLDRPAKRERELWESMWRRPQSVLWREQGLELEVALFVRMSVEALRKNAPTTVRTALIRMRHELYLTPKALSDLQVRIAPVAVADSGETRAAPSGRSSSRDRRRAHLEAVT